MTTDVRDESVEVCLGNSAPDVFLEVEVNTARDFAATVEVSGVPLVHVGG